MHQRELGGEVFAIGLHGLSEVRLSPAREVEPLRVRANEHSENDVRHPGEDPRMPPRGEVPAWGQITRLALAWIVEVHRHDGEQRGVVELVVLDTEPRAQTHAA